jgi:asparagine synthase (glutamine-hydrolysing)
MCGICGVINKTHHPVATDLLQSMSRTMRHRGPDDEGVWTGESAGLGFQRLSIIDLSGGHQPMSNEDDTLRIVFNGEIYNFQALREEIEKTGRHRFKTRSDTEVILHLYEEYGEACVEKLRGMFAFAIWDSKHHTLFLARDRFGKKPLVYADLPNVFLFGSELKALLKHPDIRKEIDYPAIDLYLTYQYIPSPWTVFKQIRKLPPAHTLTWKGGKVTLRHYWEPRYLPKTSLSFQDAGKAMMDKLREATRLRMIADVPLGAFLSGGRDSSVVVGLMSELSSQPVKTFSIGFEEEAFSELEYARVVAKHFHTDHQEFIVKPDTIEILPKLAWHYSEPYADSSALPSYYVSQMTRQHVTVALNGDGGDETLAGYPRYQAMKFMLLWDKIPRALRQAVYASLSVLPDGNPPHSKIWRIKRLLRLGLDDPRTLYLDTLCYFHESQKTDLYTPFMKQQTLSNFAPDYINGLLANSKAYSGIDAFLYTDLRSYLPECLMVKMDIASMANSLETRSPFLDHEFVELVASFPPSWKLHGLTHPKYILDKTLKGWLPDVILKRGKQGFGVPISHWFRGNLKPYVESTLLSPKAISRGLFEKSTVERYLSENSTLKQDHTYRLWALLMLEHWYQVFIDKTP